MKKKEVMSLGDVQKEVQLATAELKAAQTVFLNAQKRLRLADERRIKSIVVLNKEVATLKAAAHVSSLDEL
jgi:hypothetical protein